MNFHIEKPWALFIIFALIFAWIFLSVSYKKIFSSIEFFKNKNFSNQKNIKSKIALRIFFRSLAFVFLILAYAGISWGTIFRTEQKTGSAAAFVFDISFSMNACDEEGSLSRLQAASIFANALLEKMSGSSVSVILQKGKSVIAIPQTQDTFAIRSLLQTLSAKMLSSAGSDLASGVEAALNSFPKNSAAKNTIFIFTDGEETSGNFSLALNSALRKGVSVCVIGFGSENETEIFAGDGKTLVRSALRKEKILQAVDQANKKNFGNQGFNFFKGANAKFIKASSPASAVAALSLLEENSAIQTSSEIQSVSRHKFFLLFAILFFFASFFASELNVNFFAKKIGNEK